MQYFISLLGFCLVGSFWSTEQSCKALSHAFVTSLIDIITTLFLFFTYQEVLDLSEKHASLRSYVLWQCARDKKGLYTAQLGNLSCKLLVRVNGLKYWYNTVIIIYSSVSYGGIVCPQLPSTSVSLDPLFGLAPHKLASVRSYKMLLPHVILGLPRFHVCTLQVDSSLLCSVPCSSHPTLVSNQYNPFWVNHSLTHPLSSYGCGVKLPSNVLYLLWSVALCSFIPACQAQVLHSASTTVLRLWVVPLSLRSLCVAREKPQEKYGLNKRGTTCTVWHYGTLVDTNLCYHDGFYLFNLERCDLCAF